MAKKKPVEDVSAFVSGRLKARSMLNRASEAAALAERKGVFYRPDGTQATGNDTMGLKYFRKRVMEKK